jgi:hypothetical protein
MHSGTVLRLLRRSLQLHHSDGRVVVSRNRLAVEGRGHRAERLATLALTPRDAVGEQDLRDKQIPILVVSADVHGQHVE